MSTIIIEVKYRVPLNSKEDFMKAIKKSEMMNVSGVELDGFTIKDNSKEEQKIKNKKD